MNVFLKVLSTVLIKQIIFLIVFALSVQINADGGFIMVFILLVAYLLIHLIYDEKISKFFKTSNRKFNIYFIISWLFIGTIFTYLFLNDTWLWGILPKSNRMFSGLEYLLVPILLVGYIVLLIIIKVILYVVKCCHR